MCEIFVDNFAGGGGASTGIELAIGRSVDIAINHDPTAIAMHKANHPTTEHYCESVWDVDPVKACRGKPVALAWFSPDCKHFSKAKGGKPKDKKIRGLAWIVLKWAALARPRVIMLENVEEFQTWGPLNRGHRPIKAKAGLTFDKWKSQLMALGYNVEHRQLRACDYGTPTTRKRFFLIARCDGLPIVWPEPTHGGLDSIDVRCGILKPWRVAAEILDLSDIGKSIFGRKVPLKEATLNRIAKGIEKFIIKSDDPFILPDDKASFLIQYHSETSGNVVRGQSLRVPIMTIDSNPRYGLVTAFLTKFYKTGIGQDLREPLHTVTTSQGHFGLVSAFLIKYYGSSTAQSVNDPLDTITAKDRFGLVTVFINGETYLITDIFLRMLKPRELFNGNGFPDYYIIDRDFSGKPYPKKEQVAKCGNAVPPLLSKVLTEANVPEYCRKEKAS